MFFFTQKFNPLNMNEPIVECFKRGPVLVMPDNFVGWYFGEEYLILREWDGPISPIVLNQ